MRIYMPVIRILHVVGQMNCGGAETMLMSYYRNINREKIQFDFVEHCSHSCTFDREIKSLGGRVYNCPRFKIYNIFQYISWWKKFFKTHSQYRILHGHIYSSAAIYLYIAYKYGLKTIIHSHSANSYGSFKSFLKRYSRFPLRKIADFFLACSEEAGLWLFGENICKSRHFYICKNAINTEDFIFNPLKRKKIRKRLDLENAFIVGHVGRFAFPKNHDFLLDIFYKIYSLNPNAILLLVGDGELRNKIEKKVQTLSLSKAVKFLGVRSDVADLMQAMDVFLLPSLYEGIAVVAIEAQASCLPCIFSDSITPEIKITDLVKFLPLSSSPDFWAMEVLNTLNMKKRINNKDEIIVAGYDIKYASRLLSNYYIHLFTN